MDGWITIGTKLDTSGLKKDLKASEKELKEYQRDAERLTKQKAQIEVDMTNFQKEKAAYDELRNKASMYRQEIERLNNERKALSVNGEVAYNDAPKFSSLTENINEKKALLNQTTAEIERQSEMIDKSSLKYEEQKNELARINELIKSNAVAQGQVTDKIQQANEKIRASKIKENVTEELGKTSNKMTSILGKVARWTLAIFSIRSIYSTLSSASSTLAQYNEQYAADLQYIRYALAQMLAPVLEYIVKLMYTILQYVNYIAQAWFGVNLFANASADAFTKAKSGTAGMAKNAEKMRKELQQTNFDEMNVLQDTTSSSSGGAGASGGAMPSLDLSKIENAELPGWLEWIKDHKDEILGFFKTLALIIAGIKIYELVKGVGQLFGGISSIKALGITVLILGIAVAIKGLIDYLNDPTWKNFGTIVEGIGIAIIGLGLIISSLPVAVIGAALLIHGIIIKNWEKIKDAWQKGIDWIWRKGDELQEFIGKKLDWLPEKFGTAGAIVRALIQTAVLFITSSVNSLFEIILKVFDKIYGGIKKVLDGIILIFKGNFKEGIAKVAEGIKDIIIGAWMAIYHKFIWIWEIILNMFKHGGTIFNGLKEGISDTFKDAVNGIIIGINNVMSSAFSGLNGILNRIRDIRIDFGALGSFSPFSGMWGYNPIPVPQIPRLARGTILNNPGKGTLVAGGRAIAGEAGREAYLPLSDKQLLEELGSTIGKYITINATVNNSMNGRLISRIMQQIQAEQDFAYNT